MIAVENPSDPGWRWELMRLFGADRWRVVYTDGESVTDFW